MEVRLVMFREDGSRRTFALAPGPTTIGRKDDCTIRIPLAIVSRRHSEIVVADKGATLRDLGAANGTYLNNKRIQQEVLKAGDQIMVGPVVLTVQINGKPNDDELVEIRTKLFPGGKARGRASVGTSKHVSVADEEVDPITALEALASSADQTAINPEGDKG